MINKNISLKKKVILCFVKYYLPGYRYGGPVRSIVNFVEEFGDQYDIRIVCSSQDALDNKPYKGITIEEWNQVGKAKVFYVSNKLIKFKKIFKLLRQTKFDVLYLNSFFTFTFSIFPLLVQYFNFTSLKSCVIAPRGEFAKNAIKLKKFKKLMYIYFAKFIGLYDNLCWQASSNLESKDISRELKNTPKTIKVAPDLISSNWIIRKDVTYQKKDKFKIIFLSRISPMKNLDFLIKVLCSVSCPLEVSIIGPKDDKKYWEECKKLIKKAPKNVKIKIGEEIHPENVPDTFSRYNLFVFPTRGENFGHVIPEALSVGTPILLSDQTHWEQDNSLGLQILPLNNDAWKNAIEEWAKLSEDEIFKRKIAALDYAQRIKLRNKQSFLKNKKLFDYKLSCLN